MSDKKFTDDEVIKALECCSGSTCRTDCPLSAIPEVPCDSILNKAALALINRQKAEIERLYKEIGRISKMTVETNVKEMTEGGEPRKDVGE